MRITQRMMMDNAVQYMSSNLEKLQDYQDKVATGKEFTRPSDNPSGFATSMIHARNQPDLPGYRRSHRRLDDSYG
jgi:flagellin-like hook-associated protein FlgL